MIFKVYYQENANEVPVRENTKTMYIEAESQVEVRKKLSERKINIEFIQKVDGAYLEYEILNEDYKVLEI
ncbi:DNA-dependent RNA polymerase subunit epsilon [Bacillus sinesaloumensis]|uniref:DNA-dependent RNA polymerase subunit epsilon n=1 Tax=Litchfieldia sinesaloumensis TaxID=1926280 RepID=UPI00098892BD|nr:DNA-directed RNA polymerase subunit epsilon [Bacillus sinesaloumensis]